MSDTDARTLVDMTEADESLVAPTLSKRSDRINPTEFQVPVPRWRRLLDHIGITGASVKPRWRLNAELAKFTIENPNMSDEEHDLVTYARAVEDGDVDSAWTALNAAKRIVLGRVSSVDERAWRADALRVEVDERMTGWRQGAAKAALAVEEGAPPPSVESLVHAQLLIDEHNDGRYRQIAIHARSLRFLGSLVIGLLVAFALIVWSDVVTFPAKDGATSVLQGLGSYVTVVVLGAMGALLSVFTTRIGGPDANPIQDLANRVAGYVRPLLGSLSAVVVVLVLESGVQNVISLGDTGIFVGALLAGFSERLILRALGGIAE